MRLLSIFIASTAFVLNAMFVYVQAADAVVVDATGNTTVTGNLTVQGVSGVNAANVTISRAADAGPSEAVKGNDSRLFSVWTAFTPTFGATTTAPTPGANVTKCFWRRDGSDMLIQFYFSQENSAGTAGVGAYTISIPGGYSINSTICEFGACTTALDLASVVGQGYVTANGPSGGDCKVVTVGSQTLGLMATNQLSVSRVSNSWFHMGYASVHYSFTARIPIAGW